MPVTHLTRISISTKMNVFRSICAPLPETAAACLKFGPKPHGPNDDDQGPSDEGKMEKFTKFRDPGTGIAPFLPIAPGNRTPLFLPLDLTLCLFRIPLLFMIFGLEVILVEGLGELCLRRVAPRILGWIRCLFLRTILLLCGIWWIDEQLDGVTKSYVSRSIWKLIRRQRKLAIPPKSGDVIVSNHTSPLDLIYLAAK
jgi:1-acylglycerol-3-phosphate O-acyltransferase